MIYWRIVILFFLGLLACSVFADLPTARESDKRLQSEGKGWRLEKAQIINSKMPRILLIGDSILNGYARQVIKKLDGKAYVDMWVKYFCDTCFLHISIREHCHLTEGIIVTLLCN